MFPEITTSVRVSVRTDGSVPIALQRLGPQYSSFRFKLQRLNILRPLPNCSPRQVPPIIFPLSPLLCRTWSPRRNHNPRVRHLQYPLHHTLHLVLTIHPFLFINMDHDYLETGEAEDVAED